MEKRYLTPKSKNTPLWYTEVIQLSKLADYGPVRGTMIIRPYGYTIWENIQREFNQSLKKLGVENAYFPLFIPMSFLKREKEHVKGFAPELAVVTHGGGKKLREPLVVRPTSETIMYETFSKWISSWRDLPLKVNQWSNVVRWEKRTYFFLRTLEFLWQEGHTAHATYDEAEQMALDALYAYDHLYKSVFAIEGLLGIKSDAEKFAGAHHTYTVELLMPEGKVLQAGTSHHLSDNFSKVFDIKFQDKDGNTKYVYQTSWGLSTRSIGGLILLHGDDHGLVLPPKLAPVKVVIIPVLGEEDSEILAFCKKVKEEIESFTSIYPGEVIVDADSEKSFGWKVNEAEIKGIPIRVTVGPKELKNNTLTLNYRLSNFIQEELELSNVAKKVEEMLGKIQEKMFANSKEFLNKNIFEAENYQEFQKIMKTKKGLIKAFWCENPTCEAKIKKETKATTRLRPLNAKKQKGSCIYCGKKAQYIWYFSQAY